MKQYRADYILYRKGKSQQSDSRVVTGCMNELFAKLKLESELRQENRDFEGLVITKCEEDIFGRLFGKDNPFK